MKASQLTIKLIIIVFISFLPYSCQEYDHEKNAINTDGVIDYEAIGEEHNKGMDMLFNVLKTMKANNQIAYNISDYLDQFETAAIDFTIQNHPELSDEGIEELAKNVDNIKQALNDFNDGLDPTNGRTENTYLHYQLFSDIQGRLTSNQNKYLQQIAEAATSGNDVESILETLSNIEAEIKINCVNNELPVLLTSISIAKHSSQYWSENYSKWADEFEGGPTLRIEGGCVSWGAVGGADLAAGVTTGVLTSTALVVPFIGWGTWATITGGATVLASAGTAVLYVFNCSQQRLPTNFNNMAYPSSQDFLPGGTKSFLDPSDLIKFPG